MSTQVYDPSTAYEAGRWIVSYWGLKFRTVRQVGGREEFGAERFATLGEAQQAADARNGGLS